MTHARITLRETSQESKYTLFKTTRKLIDLLESVSEEYEQFHFDKTTTIDYFTCSASILCTWHNESAVSYIALLALQEQYCITVDRLNETR